MMGGAARPGSVTAWALSGTAWLVYAFFYAPIALLVVFSFSDDRNVGRWGGFTLSWYEQFIDHSQLQNSLWVSIRVAVLSTVISVVLGTLAALALERFRFRGQRVFDALLYLPIIIPDVTMAVMMLLFFSEGIRIAELAFGLDLTKGFTTITISHIAFNISFVSVVVRARLSGMNEQLEEAALDLYANRWRSFRYVTLPQIAPGIAGGALLALTLSLDDVVVTQFASGPGFHHPAGVRVRHDPPRCHPAHQRRLSHHAGGVGHAGDPVACHPTPPDRRDGPEPGNPPAQACSSWSALTSTEPAPPSHRSVDTIRPQPCRREPPSEGEAGRG